MGGDGNDGILARWSRRKRAARESPPEDEAVPAPAETPASPVDEAEAAELSDAELADKLGLPDPAAMKAGDDFKAFLVAGVPGRLRNAALRQLWRSNPALTSLDALVDYADDYTQVSRAGAAVATTYRVGEGLRAHVEALARETERVEAPPNAGAAETAPPAAEPPAENGPAEVPEDRGEAEAAPQTETPSPARTEAPRRRRMVFTPRDGSDLEDND